MTQLMLLFRIGPERYALETKNIIEIIHRVDLSKGHGLSPAITGQFNYHGQIVPVLDLSLLLGGHPSRPALGTRIILMELSGADGHGQQLGFLVEHVTETLERNQFESVSKEFHASHLESPLQNSAKITYIKETLLYQGEIVQCLQPENLLTELGSDTLSATGTSASTKALDTDANAFDSSTQLKAVTTGG